MMQELNSALQKSSLTEVGVIDHAVQTVRKGLDGIIHDCAITIIDEFVPNTHFRKALIEHFYRKISRGLFETILEERGIVKIWEE